MYQHTSETRHVSEKQAAKLVDTEHANSDT